MTPAQSVWVVDDDPSIRKSLSKSLGKRGYNVQLFASAAHFLSTINAEVAGCVLLDLSMPDTNGLQLQQMLLERGIRLPIIFISGHGGIPESVKALRSGALDFLEKPFEQSVLLERIEEAFTLNRADQEQGKNLQAAKSRLETLSDREVEVMSYLVSSSAKGSSREIAKQLGISHRTVEIHRARIMDKTQAQSVTELVRMYDLVEKKI